MRESNTTPSPVRDGRFRGRFAIESDVDPFPIHNDGSHSTWIRTVMTPRNPAIGIQGHHTANVARREATLALDFDCGSDNARLLRSCDWSADVRRSKRHEKLRDSGELI